MTVTNTVRIMSAEEIAARPGGVTAFLNAPERTTLFAERSLRLRQLAAGHAMRDFLIFMADVAQAQHHLLQQYPSVPLPDAAALGRAAREGAPPLSAVDWPRDAVWRDGLRRLIVDLKPRVPPVASGTLDVLLTADDEHLERQADRLLIGVMAGLDLASAPIVAAALQVYWTHMLLEVRRLHEGETRPAIDRIDDPTVCPCCGSRPTASITRLGSDVAGQRYLHCALCSAQWHMVRVKCSRCQSVKGIAYQALEALHADRLGRPAGAAVAAVQVETCDECDGYLKIVHMEKDPHVDPVADDLASLTLDLLVSETGKQRHGVNLMLLFGDPDAAIPDDGGGG